MKEFTKKEDIRTFKDACDYLGYDAETVIPDFSATAFPESHIKAIQAHSKLIIIANALNVIENDGKPWKPNWKDWNETKYYPWFTMGSPSGSGFSFFGYDYWFTTSSVGSRLCFSSRELAKYAGSQFEELYREYFVME